MAVLHHLHAQFGVGGMHRHIDGADVHFNNAVDLVLRNVGQGDIVAEQKGHSRIVILEVKTFAQAFGQLVYKAEDALVAATLLLVHQVGIKIKADILPILLTDSNSTFLSVAKQAKLQPFIHDMKAVIEHVVDHV